MRSRLKALHRTGNSIVPDARGGFTLVEMLVVIGIIAILIGASIASFSKMTKSAERADAQELVSGVATALTAMFQQDGVWNKRLANEARDGDGTLDAKTAYALVSGTTKYFSLNVNSDGTALAGHDRFGIISPWAAKIVKRKGNSAQETDIKKDPIDHYLHFALDLDGDGIVSASVGGRSVDVRATAVVWCGGKDGVIAPYPYAGGGGSGSKGKNTSESAAGRTDDVYSWTPGQTKEVK